MIIDAKNLTFDELNAAIRQSADREITVKNCFGQRYIGTGVEDKVITIEGTAGNATGAYLNRTDIRVKGNAQDAVGDTMNEGLIVIEGNAGDATGYGARGGKIYIKGSVGYRAGIHMKAYKEKRPVLIIGERSGSFLGEYQAGGFIVVLNLSELPGKLVGNFCATGMHGGKIFFRTNKPLEISSASLLTRKAEQADMEEILPYLEEYCRLLGIDEKILADDYYMIIPNTDNPYKQLYTYN
ncbi:MAG: glutamate synthase [Clostridia bacterium]|nr:glutamate synthase [Clostridia bacterium]